MLATLITAMLASHVLPSAAATYNWQVSSGNWTSVSNWGGAVPGISDIAVITNGGSANVTSVADRLFGTLQLGGTGSGTVQLLSGGRMSVSGDEVVGNTGVGLYTQSVGTNSVTNNLYLGKGTAAVGTYNLSGGSLAGNAEYVERQWHRQLHTERR